MTHPHFPLAFSKHRKKIYSHGKFPMEFHDRSGRKKLKPVQKNESKTESERPTNDYKCLAFDNTRA